jgi:exopolysaccharide biosynthesis polyprenyl glycosylphosphotransferase
MLSSQDIAALNATSKSSSRREPTHAWIHVALLIIDVLTVGMGLLLAYGVRFRTNWAFFYESGTVAGDIYVPLMLLSIPAWLAIFAVYQLYNPRHLFGGMDEYSRVFNACTTGVVLIMVTSFLFPDLVIARGWVLASWFSVTGLVGLGRFAMRRGVYQLHARGYLLHRMLIVGADAEGIAVAEQLIGNRKAGVSLVGFVDDRLPKGAEVLPGRRILGSTEDLRALVRELGVEELTVSPSALTRAKLLDIFHTFGNEDEISVRLSSGLFEILTTGLEVKSIGQVPLLSLNKVRLSSSESLLKSIVDYVGAFLGLVALSPLFGIVALVIKRTSPGPVFHRRRVVGVGGKEFDAFKFRTMVANADEWLEENPDLKAEYAENFKLKDDPRVTSIGRLLRKTSIDELPQLINVLRGEMSLVGPRMIVKEEVDRYGKWSMNLFTVKPGITGLWQVSGRSDVDYEGRVRIDMHYIRNYTVWLDLQILFQTIPAILRGRGAY